MPILRSAYHAAIFLQLLAASGITATGCGANGEMSPISLQPNFASSLDAVIDRIFPQIQASGHIAGVRVGTRSWSAKRCSTTLHVDAPLKICSHGPGPWAQAPC